jgi:hypothetical protein
MYTVRPAVTFIKKPRPASFYVRATLGLYGKHKKGPLAGGAFSGDPWSFGAGLCRILHPDFQEFSFLSTSVKIASAAAPFSWLRGGPPRAMDHLGEFLYKDNEGDPGYPYAPDGWFILLLS